MELLFRWTFMLTHRRGRSRLSVWVQPWETCAESSRLRRCDLVRITCQIPDRDVMRRSTIDVVPLAGDLRDGGDGGRLSKHHRPSTLGINLGSLRSTHITPAYAPRARRDTSRCSVALPRCLRRQAALLGMPQCRDAAGACPSREGAGSQSRLKRIRRGWYRRICNLSRALSRVTPHSLDQRSAAESHGTHLGNWVRCGGAKMEPDWALSG